jgi:hypothetical protein
VTGPVRTRVFSGFTVVTGTLGSAQVTIRSSFNPADFNQDRRVDEEDFGLFRDCATRDRVPYVPVHPNPTCAMSVSEGFLPADFDHDNDVDANDFGKFQRCYTGEAGGSGATCADCTASAGGEPAEASLHRTLVKCESKTHPCSPRGNEPLR